MSNSKPLAGKTAVVTGAGRGIGRSIALAFAQAGADLALCARSAHELADVKDQAEALGVKCLVQTADLSDPESTGAFCETVATEFHDIYILVNNAGAYLENGAFADSNPDDWWRTVEVNIRGPYLLTRLLLSEIADGGKILNLSSGKALNAGNNSSSYHVSKAGLHMLTEALANELWPRGIDVNNLIPGPTATNTLTRAKPDALQTADDIMERFADDLPPGLPAWERMKHPDEIGQFALYLATLPKGGPTGQTFSLARRPL